VSIHPVDRLRAEANGEADNVEWQLAELVDAIAAEIDQAEDSLSLKSYARGIAFALKELHLDLGVTIRRSQDGGIFFRTVEPGDECETVLKLDFAQVLQAQLESARQDLTETADRRPVTSLPGITDDEVRRLGTVAIFSMDDLVRYTATPALISEVARKTRIPEARVRMWRGLPYVERVQPPTGPPGGAVTIEGGNFGASIGDGAYSFKGRPATVVAWSSSRVVLQMPAVSGEGLITGVVAGWPTNLVSWSTSIVTSDVIVRKLTGAPSRIVEGDEVTVTAEVFNRATTDSPPFNLQWKWDGSVDPPEPHGLLRAGQMSRESSTVKRRVLSAGTHEVMVTVDPERSLPEVDRAAATSATSITVAPAAVCRIGEHRRPLELDPFRPQAQPSYELGRLVSRGLLRIADGQLVPDLATVSSISPTATNQTRVQLELREARWHDGTSILAEDVAFTYDRRKAGEAVPNVLKSLTSVEVQDDRRVALTIALPFAQTDPALFTLPLIPKHAYDASTFARAPVGAGPFLVQKPLAADVLTLRAFDDFYGGIPRLTHIQVTLADSARLIDLFAAGNLEVAVVEYSSQNLTRLRKVANARVTPLPAARPTVIDVQSARVRARDASKADVNWNAHLWDLGGGAAGS
jgi:peptide/nickel transport system substrate-binding protein